MESELIDILPAIHALTGCDTTSKVGTKAKALIKGKKGVYTLLCNFGKEEINGEINTGTEKFFLKFITSRDVESFDDLRFLIYHTKHHQFDREWFPPTSACIKQHIFWVYLQCYMWFHAPFTEDIQVNFLDCGYILADDEHLLPVIMAEAPIPDEFPAPCNCLKCAKP